jgi:hypothetical protein
MGCLTNGGGGDDDDDDDDDDRTLQLQNTPLRNTPKMTSNE